MDEADQKDIEELIEKKMGRKVVWYESVQKNLGKLTFGAIVVAGITGENLVPDPIQLTLKGRTVIIAFVENLPESPYSDDDADDDWDPPISHMIPELEIESEESSESGTAANRMSAFNFCNPSDHILPIADGMISRTDRAHLWGIYSGIVVKLVKASEQS